MKQSCYIIISIVLDCRTEQRGYIGMFTSQSYPNNYDNNLRCEWLIMSEPSTKIQMRFTDFDLERDDDCNYDFLEIYDGKSRYGTLLGRYCSNEIPDLIESSSNRMFLYFQTDVSDTRRGFETTWIALGRQVIHDSGIGRRQISDTQGKDFFFLNCWKKTLCLDSRSQLPTRNINCGHCLTSD